MEVQKSVALNLAHGQSLNYAMVVSKVPFLQKFTLRNLLAEPIGPLTVTISFSGEVASPYEKVLPSLPGGVEVDLCPIDIALRKEVLFSLTEAMTMDMEILVLQEDQVLLKEVREVELLAYNQWQGMDTMPEVLAAFVTPNHPAIDDVLLEAAKLLKGQGDDPAFLGYQRRDIHDVRLQVHAIYTALARRKIKYIGPPASFTKSGQRIRLASEVLEKGFGTCLDLTLLMASCLEAISLHPLLILIHGHAFLGFWQEEEYFTEAVIYDGSSIKKRVAEGMAYIGLLETTVLRDGVAMTFDEAEEEAKKHFVLEESFLLAVDVKRARAGGIYPLPERVLKEGQLRLEEVLEPRSLDLAGPKRKDVVRWSEEPKESPVSKATRWERKLLDLSLRNQLLNYTPERKGLSILTKECRSLEDALYEGKEFLLLHRVKDQEVRGTVHARSYKELLFTYGDLLEEEFSQGKLRTRQDEEALYKKLTKLYRDAKTHMEESGANHLFLALGLLKWYENGRRTKERYAPILLLPVELKKKAGKQSYSLFARDEDTLMNVTLLEKLKMDFGLDIPFLGELPQDDKGVDVQEVFRRLRQGILAKEGWDVLEEVHLSIFSFSKFVMWHDLKTHGEDLRKNELIASLMEGQLTFLPKEDTAHKPLDETVDPREILLPVSTDASQLRAVVKALSGESFVLHGPPGTGKSQTITTIIANALYQGKKVLFVAEKMAALSVVQRRLEQLGLGAFSLEVHSNKSKKSAILKKLEETVNMAQGPEVPFHKEAERLRGLRKELASFVDALYVPQPMGLSVYELMGALEALKDAPSIEGLDRSYDGLTKDGLDHLLQTAREFASAAEAVGPYAQAPLKGLTLRTYDFTMKNSLAKPMNTLVEKSKSLGEALDALAKLLQLEDVATKEKMEALAALLAAQKTLPYDLSLVFQGEDEDIEALLQVVQEAGQLKEQLLSRFQESIIQVDPQGLLQTFDKGEGQLALFGRFTKKKVLKALGAHSIAGPVREEEVRPYLKALLNYQGLLREEEAQLEKLPSLRAVGSLPMKKAQSLALLLEHRRILRAHLAWFSLGEGRTIKAHVQGTYQEVETFLSAFEDYQNTMDTYKDVLPLSFQTLDLLEGHFPWRLHDRLLTYLNNLEVLREWTRYNEEVRKAFGVGLKPLVETYEKGICAPKELPEVLRKTLYEGAFLASLKKEPLLMKVTGKSYEDTILYFKESISRYEALAKLEIQRKLSAGVPNMMREAHGSSEVGILQRAMRSGGRGTSLRHLFMKLPNLLQRITPCMLMSPLSVAQYLSPKETYFDLIIFDEASQMPTAESVGAMARGKHVVIVGDPKQLPPTSFFQVGPSQEDEEEELEDLENILEDALALSMKETSLLWHYRSRHESLIAFSNQTYYDQKLYTYPSPFERVSKVTYAHVDAVYDRGKTRANEKEAEKVVEEVLRRLKDEATKEDSLGVVTFSMAQKNIIEDLLEEALQKDPLLEEQVLSMEEPLFVKNLENVQGDERDVILFSVGYGPDDQGKITMNFGPLNKENGWKRLNVAITRAKKEMKIFTSILPEQMDTTKTSARGVQDLKAFLDYARRGKRLVTLEELTVENKEAFLFSVKKALEDKGFQVDAHVGASKFKVDLAVHSKDKEGVYALGIQCFGEAYKEAETVRDREVLQEGVLTGLGWKTTNESWRESSPISRILRKRRHSPGYKDLKPHRYLPRSWEHKK